jgi:hypothetical protein
VIDPISVVIAVLACLLCIGGVLALRWWVRTRQTKFRLADVNVLQIPLQSKAAARTPTTTVNPSLQMSILAALESTTNEDDALREHEYSELGGVRRGPSRGVRGGYGVLDDNRLRKVVGADQPLTSAGDTVVASEDAVRLPQQEDGIYGIGVGVDRGGSGIYANSSPAIRPSGASLYDNFGNIRARLQHTDDPDEPLYGLGTDPISPQRALFDETLGDSGSSSTAVLYPLAGGKGAAPVGPNAAANRGVSASRFTGDGDHWQNVNMTYAHLNQVPIGKGAERGEGPTAAVGGGGDLVQSADGSITSVADSAPLDSNLVAKEHAAADDSYGLSGSLLRDDTYDNTDARTKSKAKHPTGGTEDLYWNDQRFAARPSQRAISNTKSRTVALLASIADGAVPKVDVHGRRQSNEVSPNRSQSSSSLALNI